MQNPQKNQLAALLRRNAPTHVVDATGGPSGEAAIYTLSDPRDLRLVRYVGQTRRLRTRYAQHIRAAQLWLPDELPWWIRQEELRPLYTWIRALHADDARLPVMLVDHWTAAPLARSAEQRLIASCLARGLPLLNCEATLPRHRTLELDL